VLDYLSRRWQGVMRTSRRPAGAPFLATASILILVCLRGTMPTLAEPNPTVAPRDWFHVIRIDSNTYALSEPKYWQANVSYLLLGTKRALLFDTGPGIYSIRDVVRSLTSFPVTVIPSHLHFDHVGRIGEFSDVALIDLEALRRQVKDGIFTEAPTQYLLQREYRIPVNHWVKDREVIDLGGRRIAVVSTQGHTPESVSLLDPSHHRLFTGDLVNREVSLLNVPGSDLRQALRSLHELARLAPTSLAYEAHSEKPLTSTELRLIARGIDDILHERIHSQEFCLSGIPALRYDIAAFPIVVPDASDQRLVPLSSVTTRLDPTDASSCRLPETR
jgi:glyoxylase-like metal-dependent hydrolase (beta-lactamase superfamily II)